jgi:anaerobic selenocysteine-containing dehydrogenase
MKKRGAKIIVVDPRCTKTASQADLYLQIKPGTDAALGLGMINVIINEGLYDKEFVEKWCTGFDKLAERVREYTPENVEKITWIPAEKIKEATRIYATTKPACMSPGHGAIHNPNGVQAARAFGCVVALTGNIDILGGNPLVKPLKGYLSPGNLLRSKEFRLPREIEEKALGASQFPLWTGPDAKMVGVVHNPTALDAMITGKPYPVKAMLTTGVNILSTYPNGRKVAEALKRLEFMVATAWFMTPTAEFADIILPKTHALESNNIAVYTGMHKCVTICQKVVEPLGEAREDLKVFTELSKRMKQRGVIEKSFIPWESSEEYLQYLLKDTEVSLEKLKQDGFVLVPPVWKKYEKQGFPTPSGKVELYSSTLEKLGYDPLPNHKELPENDISTPELAKRYPLMLVTGKRVALTNSRFPVFSWAREVHPDPEVEIHPEAAKERGIRSGDWVWIETPKGRCKNKAMITDKIHPMVVESKFGWWFPEMPAPEHGCFEANVNAVMSYDAPHDPIMGIPTVMGVLCEVTKMKVIS